MDYNQVYHHSLKILRSYVKFNKLKGSWKAFSTREVAASEFSSVRRQKWASLFLQFRFILYLKGHQGFNNLTDETQESGFNL